MFLPIQQAIEKVANPQKAVMLQKYFKQEKGSMGQGDIFLGLTVPQSRSIAKQFRSLSLPEVKQLVTSKFHEYRQIGLMILVLQFKKASLEEQKNIFDFYLSHTHFINNWDLNLIQKALGWMLREAGKRVSIANEKEFLKKYYKKMGRTALRYSIERFEENERQQYLHGTI